MRQVQALIFEVSKQLFNQSRRTTADANQGDVMTTYAISQQPSPITRLTMRQRAPALAAKLVMAAAAGLLALGRTVRDAFMLMYNFEQSCRIQVDAMAAGRDRLTLICAIVFAVTLVIFMLTYPVGTI